MRDCGRGKWWKKVAPIEHGERRAQHDHADGQGQDPPRHVIRLVSLDADLAPRIDGIHKIHGPNSSAGVRGWRFLPPVIRHEFITKRTHSLAVKARSYGSGPGVANLSASLSDRTQRCLNIKTFYPWNVPTCPALKRRAVVLFQPLAAGPR